ncbi:hypothetical protein [Nocardioides ferulae]|uniref:hypothetical protein n=1 Tax=Nocardioides ferulae TaxID=2340821 RepID=UPI000EAD9967|nr:hypothetical protein [Nocardioides ferulae]
MRIDWVPASAALLVTGAMSLAFAQLLAAGDSDLRTALSIVEREDGRWLAASALDFLAAVALTMGVPAVLSLFRDRGRYTSVAAACLLVVGFVGLAGYSMLLVFFRALVRSDAVRGRALDDVLDDPGLQAFLIVWVAAFLIGELLLLIALVQAGPAAAPAWVPVALGAHLFLQSLLVVLPETVARSSALLLTAALCGLAIRAARPEPAHGTG